MNLLFSSIWWKKVWRMNRPAKGLLIVTTNLVWQTADDLPNSPNFPAIQYTIYAEIFEGHKVCGFGDDIFIFKFFLLHHDTFSIGK